VIRRIRRIRRRRAKILGLVSGCLLAVAAVVAAIPVALSGPAGPSPSARPASVPLGLSFTVAVNGQSRVFPGKGPQPRFTVTRSERLRIRIGVAVRAHTTVTALWLGVTTGVLGSPGREGQRPTGMRPVLAHTGQRLTSGRHTFSLTWTMPAHLPAGTTLLLAAAWEQGDAGIGQAVAVLALRR